MEFLNRFIAQNTGILWYPSILLGILVMLVIVLTVWGRLYFRRDYNNNSPQVKPFNSGNLDEIDYNISSSNLFWGFRKALESYYTVMISSHSGDLNDYLKWLAISIAVCFLLIAGGVL